MTIAIASGKGGTGKTSLAVALGRAAVRSLDAVTILDCDVEEPNAGIFFGVERECGSARGAPVEVPVPEVDPAKCSSCGNCVKVCRFNAIVLLKTSLMIFPELCHSCGGCVLACPAGALVETPRRIGCVYRWALNAEGQLLSSVDTDSARPPIKLHEGLLDLGRAMSPPVIRAVKKTAGNGLVLIDCPPGTSCPMVTAVRDTDYVVFVTEPTPFGLHDLSLAVDTARSMGLSFGVVINRAGDDDRVDEYCKREGIALLASLPEDRRIAESYSRGASMYEAGKEWEKRIDSLLKGLLEAAQAAGAGAREKLSV